MTIARLATSSLNQGPVKKKAILAGNLPILSGAYESIATVDVGSGGQTTVSFTSIPSTYKHLQIRAIARGSQTAQQNLLGSFNSDTTHTNYYWHYISGDGASASAGAVQSSTARLSLGLVVGTGQGTNLFSANVIDILDYASTNKNKTVRILNGIDANGSGDIRLTSGLWMNTSAITSIDLTVQGSNNFAQYSSFALYGIR